MRIIVGLLYFRLFDSKGKLEARILSPSGIEMDGGGMKGFHFYVSVLISDTLNASALILAPEEKWG